MNIKPESNYSGDENPCRQGCANLIIRKDHFEDEIVDCLPGVARSGYRVANEGLAIIIFSTRSHNMVGQAIALL